MLSLLSAEAHCMVHHVSYLTLGGEQAVKNDSKKMHKSLVGTWPVVSRYGIWREKLHISHYTNVVLPNSNRALYFSVST